MSIVTKQSKVMVPRGGIEPGHKDFQSSCKKKCSGFIENPNPP